MGFHKFVLDATGDTELAKVAARAARDGAYHVVEFAPHGRLLGEEYLMHLGSWGGSLRIEDGDPGYEYAKKKLRI